MHNLTKVENKLKAFLQKPEYVFIGLASFFGIIMVFLMPFFMVPDETAHLYRAYQVSTGGIVSESTKTVTGGMVPIDLQLSIRDYTNNVGLKNHQSQPIPYYKYFTDRINTKDQTLVDFRSAAIYSPVAYIPQTVGLKLAQIVYPSLGVMMILARFANLAMYILLISIAIRIATKGKWVYAVLGLFPIAIQQAASLSSDVMTMGIAFIWIALISNIYLQKENISKKQWVVALVLAIGLGLTKQTNIVLLLPLLFIPVRIFNNNWHKFRFVISVFSAGVLATALWFIIMQINHYNLQISKDTLVNQAGQITFLIQQPLHFIVTLWHTYVTGALSDFYITSMHSVFSWITYRLPLSFVVFGYAGLLVAFIYNDGDTSYKLPNKPLTRLAVVQALAFVASLIIIAGVLYLAWTPVGESQVSGIQGRYFLPLVPLLIPMFMLVRRRVKITTDKPYNIGVLVSIISGVNLIAMLAVTYKWFY